MVTPKVGFELGADLAHIQFISKARYFGQSNAEQKVFQHCITSQHVSRSAHTRHYGLGAKPDQSYHG